MRVNSNEWLGDILCEAPDPTELRGPGLRRKVWGNWWKQLFIFCHFLPLKRVTPWVGFTEIGLYICGLRRLISLSSPCVHLEVQWAHSARVTPALKVAPAVRSDVALICCTARVSLSLYLSVQSAKRYCSITLLDLKGFQVSWDCAWAKVWVYSFLGLCLGLYTMEQILIL